MKLQHRLPRDYREFLFTATWAATDLSDISPIELYDNLIVEVDRLRTLARLLEGHVDELSIKEVRGAGVLLRDVWKRIEALLDLVRQAASGRTRQPPR